MNVGRSRKRIEGLFRVLDLESGDEAAMFDDKTRKLASLRAGLREAVVHNPVADVVPGGGESFVTTPLRLSQGDARGGRGHHGVEQIDDVDEGRIERRIHRSLLEAQLQGREVVGQRIGRGGDVARVRRASPGRLVWWRSHGGAWATRARKTGYVVVSRNMKQGTNGGWRAAGLDGDAGWPRQRGLIAAK